jgi:hypothetical protein
MRSETPDALLSFIELRDVRCELNLDSHTAVVILFQGDACEIQESIMHQGETFQVRAIRATRLRVALKVLMIPDSITSIAAQSCCDAANLRGLSFSPSSSLRHLCGFEGSGFQTLEVPPATEFVSEEAFAGSVLVTSLHFGCRPVIREIDGSRGCGIVSVAIPASVHVVKSNGFAECQFLQAVSFETVAQVTWIDAVAHSGLRHLGLPPSVSVIESSGFNSCQYLQSLAIPEQSSLRRVTGYRNTRLQRIVVDGPIDSRSLLDSMINPNCQTFLEHREKELSEMRRDFAMIGSF